MSEDKNSFEHYYSEEPQSVLRVRDVELKLKNGHVYKFKSPSGVYSFGKVDKATEILINHCENISGKVLDIGCGYGVIGITLKKENPSIELFMSDVNKRAVEFAKINAKDNNIQADIRQGNLYEPWEGYLFDHIISNPPIVAGKEVWMKLIEGAFQHLKDGGTLQLVAYHNKGGERIKNYMKEIFGNAEDVWKEGGIRIYISKKING
ncbi:MULTISPECIES: class I SAM-dependent methyltransferase [Fervidobacterium]|uniref:Methyltransferase small n=1 Tax=Fervidobacterium nodosum (strain ATCC 35602 / DSM 5306 / Rt17-B1) TaxID=381764 RepID=A7HMI7_FERNB|nr:MULTISPECIES: class I SAM-dependent methyltransferase [Fervidobacterium]ABS61120.1 methyltransferase small [Fervidobacterium nodosum Rt17-B1]KAF2961365.1 SAM-dependent methyltransferase [Fervidobacterium sp. 2310opik-2]